MFGLLTAPVSENVSAQVAREGAPNRPTETIDNLHHSVAADANAAHRYDLFADRADRDGLSQVAKLFRAVAVSERIHVRRHNAVLRELGVAATQPHLARIDVQTTRENLRAALEGEPRETDETFAEPIRIAEQEHIAAAGRSFRDAREAERVYRDLFRGALDRLGQNELVDYLVDTETGMIETAPSQR